MPSGRTSSRSADGMGTQAPPEEASTKTARLLDALGSAWSTYNLYPDPGQQPAFDRAASWLANEVTEPVMIVIGPGEFMQDDERVEVSREGAVRLARELFLHDIEHLCLREGISADSLLSFFGALAREDDHIRDLGGLASMLSESPPLGIEVYERGLLDFHGIVGDAEVEVVGASAPPEGMSPAAAAAQRGAEPAEVARVLLETQLGADDAVPAFLDGLRQLLEHAKPDPDVVPRRTLQLRQGVGDPWSGLRTYLESFLHLDRNLQVWVLESVLANIDDAANRIFLDQLADAEIADFLPDLGADASTALAAYATIVGSEAGRPESEARPASSTRFASTRQVVAARIGEVLRTAAAREDDADGLVADLRDAMEQPVQSFELTRDVLRGLFECEKRADRFRRVARVWAARVTRAMRDGDFEKAARLLGDAMEEARYEEAMQSLVDEAIERIVARDSLQFLVQHHGRPTTSEGAISLVEKLGPRASDSLITMLAEANEPTERKLLIDLVAASIKNDPGALDVHIGLHEWYVLRNLATALGNTGRRGAVPQLRRLLAHDHHEIRIEAMRSLTKVLGRDAAPHLAALLEDGHERVRQAAASLLRASDHPEIDHLLAARLDAARLDLDTAVVVVRILAARKSEEGVAKLRALAAQRWLFAKRPRTIRNVARAALREMQ